jgi:hypothetical protein
MRPLSDKQIVSILDDDDLLLIYGQVLFEDYEGRSWERGFAFRWEPSGADGEGEGCRTFNAPGYNYQRLAQPQNMRPALWRRLVGVIHPLRWWRGPPPC